MKRLVTTISSITIMLAAILLLSTSNFAQGRADQPDLTINAATRTEVIEGVIKRLNDFYVFPEIAKQMETAIRQRVQNKEYDQITSAALLAQTLTTHLRAISHDKHLEVHYSHRPVPLDSRSEPTPEQRERMQRFAASVNFGFEKIDRLEGNIGYLRVDGFMPADVGAETAIAAMNFLANTDALIFDLRYSVNGGDPTMSTLLSSYLFGSEPVHLSDIYWREGNRTRQIWTMPYVPGKKYIGKDVYFLTSKDTISAGEGFVYELQNLKRVTVIGETTAGAANPGFEYRINEHFFMFLPMGRAINPITKTNWEGIGVKPDIEVPAEQALKTAHLMALKKLLATAKDERTQGQLRGIVEALEKKENK
jgi:C-terminal processing protease CtpA/Prc